MCGTLKFENRAHKVGNMVPIVNPVTGKEGKAKWSGFAKQEKLEFWRTRGKAVDINIKADHVVEKNIELRLRGTLKAVGLKDNVDVQGRIIGRVGEVKIVTRAPISDFEMKVHPRWPLVALPDGNIQVFNFNDVMKGPGQLALL